jgi:uncharacterized membrane protein YedE/YeeE
MRLFLIYLTGLVFGLGVSISGMANPAKVINFFDFAGIWDPSLILVMISAFVVTAIGYALVFRRPAPVFEPKFQVPTNRVIDARLVGGSAVFGVGWGLSGFCPGASVPALGTGNAQVLVFTGSLLTGIFIARWLMRQTAKLKQAATA